MPRSRRNESSPVDDLFELLLVVPVWVGPIIAAIFFAAARWLVPWMLSGEGDAGDKVGATLWPLIARLSYSMAPWVGVFVLLMWVVAEIRKFFDRRRLDEQTGIDSIRELSWREFELLLSEAFRRQGFVVDQAGGTSPDGGVDQRLSKAGAITLVQCKHWKTAKVGVKVVRELLGVVTSERANSGIVVTSGTFTDDAIEFAERNPITLIDGGELAQMIREVQCNPVAREVATESATRAAPVCPKCGLSMVLRTAKRGSNPGSQFWGCSTYPGCNGTRDQVGPS